MDRIVKFFIAAIAASIAAPHSTFAQENAEREAVLQVIDDFFIAFHEGDADRLTALFLAPGYTRAIRKTEAGEHRIREQAFDAAVESITSGDNELLELYWDPVVNIRGDLMATVWAPYEVKADGGTIHCGIDMFTLLNTDAGWRIVDLTYTAEPESCDEITPPSMEAMRPASLVHKFMLTE